MGEHYIYAMNAVDSDIITEAMERNYSQFQKWKENT